MLSSTFSRIASGIVAAAWLLSACLGPAEFAQAARPDATQLLPAETVACLLIPDARQLADRAADMSLGRMLADPQLRPLVAEVFAAVEQASEPLRERIGLTLRQLLAIPQGEVALAVVAIESGVAVVAIAELGDDTRTADTLVAQLVRLAEEEGTEVERQRAGDTEMLVFIPPGSSRAQVTLCRRESTLLATTHPDALRQVLVAWNGQSDTERLAENAAFAAVTQRVGGAGDEQAQIRLFIDPIGLVRSAAPGNPNARVGLALLPALGLDGLLAAGAGMTLATEQFDEISRYVVHLQNPRAGALQLLAFGVGDVTPEPWVPDTAANYITVHFDAAHTYHQLARLVDSFQGQGAFDARVRRFLAGRTELDIEEELLPYLDGRFTFVSAIEQPITLRSDSRLLAARLTDGEKFQATIDKVVAEYRDFVVQSSFGGHTIYQYAPPRLDDRPDPSQALRPALCRIGDWLLVGRERLLQQAIMAHDGTSARLADAIDYKLVASKAERLSGGGPVSGFTFFRPQESLRMAYGLMTGDGMRRRLGRQAQANPLAQNVGQALENNPPPPFEVLEKYFAPGGAVLVDEEAGLRYLSFSLRRSAD